MKQSQISDFHINSKYQFFCVYFPWRLYYNVFNKKKITKYCILHRRTSFDTVYCQRYHFTVYVNIWPFARTQLGTNDSTQCQNTHADVNYFSV